MKTVTVIASRDPKLIVRGLIEKTQLIKRNWRSGGPTIWDVSCKTGKLEHTRIHLQDNGVQILDKEYKS